MDSIVTFVKAGADQIHSLRKEYLDSLPYFQDVFLEFLVCPEGIFAVQNEKDTIGYFLVNPEKVLFEFYLSEPFRVLADDIFDKILSFAGIKNIYCKSFDAFLMQCCTQKILRHDPLESFTEITLRLKQR
ncbi:MAG: hypothetical protein HC906_19740 [Bacteroidales bacterium]|nr:hypothetical protein [Bacteroidales bacterium]